MIPESHKGGRRKIHSGGTYMKCRKILLLLIALLYVAVGRLAEGAPQDAFHSKYKLVQVIMLSRHNIRAPLKTYSNGEKLAGHKWHDFGVKRGALTVHGGQLEERMGQYSRLYLQQEGMFLGDYQPKSGEVLFYANAFERTIATARHFAAGMFNEAIMPVKYNGDVGDADPVFMPEITGYNADFAEKLGQEVAAMGGSESLTKSVAAGLKEASVVLGDPAIRTSELKVSVENGLQFSGSIRPFMSACDALTLQYYEQGDSRASFGHELDFRQWQQISAVKDLGIHVYRHVPTFARAMAQPLLAVFQEELSCPQRKFTFLCGHDINAATVMGALEVKNISLPESIEQEAPIGSKLVVEKWQDRAGNDFVKLKLLYPSVRQLCGRMPIDASHPPQAVSLHLQDIKPNSDGLIEIKDFQQRLTEAIHRDAELKK